MDHRSDSVITCPLLSPFAASDENAGDAEAVPTDNIDDSPLKKVSIMGEFGRLSSSYSEGNCPEGSPDDEDEPYNMKELIEEKPEDVIQYLEEEGLMHLGDFEVPDYVVLAAFGSTGEILTMGCDQLEIGWESMWRQKVTEAAASKRLPDHLRRISRAGWSQSYTLQAFVVNMADAAAEGHKGILRPLLLRYNAQACPISVFALPAVQAVIHFKWNHGARRYLMLDLTAYALWLVAFTVFTVCLVQEDTSISSWQHLWESGTGVAALISSAVSLCAMSYFLYTDFCTLLSYKWGWLNFTNVSDLISYILQILTFILHLGRVLMSSSWFSILVATQHVLMWSKLHYYARVFSPTRNLFLDTVRIVLDDAKWFILFMLLTMMGFGFAFYALFRQDEFIDFSSVWHSQASMFAYMLAMFDYSVFYNSKNPVAAMVLFMVYNVIVTVLLVNVLIAIMTNALHKVSQDEGLRFLLYRAQIIDEIESTIPRWMRRGRWPFPTYVHLLRVSPESTYEPNLYSIWSGMGSLQTNIMNAQDEARAKLLLLEGNVANLNRKVDFLTRMLLSTAATSTSSSPETRGIRDSTDPTSGRQVWEGAAGVAGRQRGTARFKQATQFGSRTTDDLDELLDILPPSWGKDYVTPRVARSPRRQSTGLARSPTHRSRGMGTGISIGSRAVNAPTMRHMRSVSCRAALSTEDESSDQQPF